MATKKKTTTKGGTSQRFTDEERAAIKERAKEVKAETSGETPGEADVLVKIAEMPEAGRLMAERIHSVITAIAPDLSPKTWYGMPGYANDGKVICFFQSAHKFKSRYASFGFNDTANLRRGRHVADRIRSQELTKDAEEMIGALVKKAVA
jgi:uncharacterized protein YdhG (YjbR/CyaY superfamily)